MNMGKARFWIPLLLIIGTLIRIQPFLYNRALEHDEAFLSNNILQKNFTALTGVLDNAQAAPILFLWLEKIAISIFGANEFALRLFPLLFGIGAIFLFVKLARKILTGPFLIIAIALFVFCNPHIFYSTDVKQYSIDAFMSIAVLLLAIKLLEKEVERKHFIRYGLFGAIAVWFSQPVIFVLGGSFTVVFGYYWSRPRQSSIKYLDIGGVIWGVSFLIYYFGFLRPSISIGALQDFHQPYYMPLKFWEMTSWKWYISSYFEFFKNPVGILFHYLAGMCFAMGLYGGIREWRKGDHREFAKILLLLLPILMAIGASGLQKYSTIPRLMLFTAPLFMLIICYGLKTLRELLSKQNWNPYLQQGAVVLGMLMLLQPVLNTIHQTAAPKQVEEIRQPMAYIAENKQAGDLLYVYPFARSQFEFYQPKYDLKDIEVMIGVSPYDDWKKDIATLKGKERVWFLLSHHKRMEGIDDRQVYPEFLNTIGKQLSQKEATGSVVFLYNLKK